MLSEEGARVYSREIASSDCLLRVCACLCLYRSIFRIDDVVMDHKTIMKKLYAMIDEQHKFQKVPLYKDVSLADRSMQVPFYVRSLYDALCRLLDRFDTTEFDLLLNLILNDDRDRVYNRDIASSDLLQRSKAWVLAKCGPDVVTPPLSLGWDGVRYLWLYEHC
jgi:hypothetical protein